MSTALAALRSLERYNPLQKRGPNGRWSDGMPDVITEVPVQTLSGSLTVRSTRHGEGGAGHRDVELDDGTHTVVLNHDEQRQLFQAMGNQYRTDEFVLRRDGKVIARVRSGGTVTSEDGEDVAAGKRLDIGEVEDPAEYDSRPGVAFSNRQADDPFTGSVSIGAAAGRNETGYGPLDSFSDGRRQMTLRMKDDNGNPTEVTFSAVEWRRIRDAYNLVWEGFDENDPDEDAPPVDSVRVKTKAGPVEVSWVGPREGYDTSESRLKILPVDPGASWGVIIDGEHLTDVVDTWEWAGINARIHESVTPTALELWRALEARHNLRGPDGRFIRAGGGSERPSLADVIRGTAAQGPKRQRDDKSGMSVATATRAAARQSDTTGRPTQRTPAEHRAEGAHAVADEVDRALADAGVPDDIRQQVAQRARAVADTHGPRQRRTKSNARRAPQAAAHASDITRRLNAAGSRDEARQHLAGLSAVQLRQLANENGVAFGTRDTKARLTDRLIDSIVGRRLDSEAIGRMTNR